MMFGDELRVIDKMEKSIDEQIADNQRLGEVSALLTYLELLQNKNAIQNNWERIEAVKESVDELLGIKFDE